MKHTIANIIWIVGWSIPIVIGITILGFLLYLGWPELDITVLGVFIILMSLEWAAENRTIFK